MVTLVLQVPHLPREPRADNQHHPPGQRRRSHLRRNQRRGNLPRPRGEIHHLVHHPLAQDQGQGNEVPVLVLVVLVGLPQQVPVQRDQFHETQDHLVKEEGNQPKDQEVQERGDLPLLEEGNITKDQEVPEVEITILGLDHGTTVQDIEAHRGTEIEEVQLLATEMDIVDTVPGAAHPEEVIPLSNQDMTEGGAQLLTDADTEMSLLAT